MCMGARSCDVTTRGMTEVVPDHFSGSPFVRQTNLVFNHRSLQGMKLLPKNLLVLFVFFVLFFGAAVFFSFSTFHRMVGQAGRTSAFLAALQIRATVDSCLTKSQNEHRPLIADSDVLKRALERDFTLMGNLENFIILNQDSSVIFSLYVKPNDELVNGLRATDVLFDSSGIRILSWKDKGQQLATWHVRELDNLMGLLYVNKEEPFRQIVHQTTLNFYVLGVAGLLTVVLLAFIISGFAKTPVRNIERAISTAPGRRRFRLKATPDSDFYSAYQKVNQMVDKLQQLDASQRKISRRKNALTRELKTMSRFLDVMAHEVKNPLHALVINLDVLKTKIQRDKSKSETLKHARILEKELDHLQEVIGGFLDFVRPGVPQKEPVDFNQVVRSVCQMAEQEASRAKVKIERRFASNMRNVNIDKNQFKQALHNIVLNAIHASSEGSKVVVRTWARRNTAFVSVKDSGSGMSPEQLEKAFDLYFTTKKNGSGIGLPISKKLIEANGGQLKVDSKPEKGTQVSISLRTVS